MAARKPATTTRGPRNPSGHRETRLQAWLSANDIAPARIEGYTGLSRPYLTALRWGKLDAGRKTMVRILGAARFVTRRRVTIEELFDLDPDNPENWK